MHQLLTIDGLHRKTLCDGKCEINKSKDADNNGCYVTITASRGVNTIRKEEDKENRHIVTKYLAIEDA